MVACDAAEVDIGCRTVDVDSSNKVTAAYVCFMRNETEYCLKGYDAEAYETKKTVMQESLSDCGGPDNSFACSGDGFNVEISRDGYVGAYRLDSNGKIRCFVHAYGSFECY